jgi:hypothetical protein
MERDGGIPGIDVVASDIAKRLMTMTTLRPTADEPLWATSRFPYDPASPNTGPLRCFATTVGDARIWVAGRVTNTDLPRRLSLLVRDIDGNDLVHYSEETAGPVLDLFRKIEGVAQAHARFLLERHAPDLGAQPEVE